MIQQFSGRFPEDSDLKSMASSSIVLAVDNDSGAISDLSGLFVYDTAGDLILEFSGTAAVPVGVIREILLPVLTAVSGICSLGSCLLIGAFCGCIVTLSCLVIFCVRCLEAEFV